MGEWGMPLHQPNDPVHPTKPNLPMDFFARQDSARRHTGLLVGYFSLAVALTILLVYFIPVIGWYAYRSYNAPPEVHIPLEWWNPNLFIGVCGATLLVVLSGALFKIAQLRRGGGGTVAELLGGKQILPGTDDFFEKRLRNVVEEMAIASGVPVPPIYVMENEKGINAFAAGFSPSDSVVAVTYGTMTGLTRDELQGVVAHEFSHILNQDMRININLMGILHGLLVIGLTGRIILELVGRGSSGRRSKDSGQITLIILVAGFTLMVVGYMGFFFCKLIKASISRSRERLADASAVQFTRNPDGLAGALKKIGGLAAGSRICSPHAEEASHMFFGNGLRGNIFNTHPPLAERVRWLEPKFSGRFDRVTHEDLRQQLTRFEGAPMEVKEEKNDVVDLFTTPGKVAVAATVIDAATTPAVARPNNPEALLASIGAPMEHHAEAARLLIESIPEEIKTHARDPYGARMLIYFILLDSNENVRNKQMTIVREQSDPAVWNILEKTISIQDGISPEMRLPIVDLAIPSLRFLSKDQYDVFRGVINQLIAADEKIDIFEYALQRVLVHHLDPAFSGRVKPRPTNYYAIRGLEQETSVVLSVLAREGHEQENAISDAFHAAAEKMAGLKVQIELLDAENCSWTALDAALEKLNEGSFKVKKWVLGAALTCLMHDREITVEEVELFRAVSDTLGCPVPPWVTPSELDDF
jgi:Zn-dependent protease with chaperone function